MLISVLLVRAVPDFWKRMALKCFITMLFTCPLLSSCKISSPFRENNNVVIFAFAIRSKTRAEQSILDRIQRSQLKWYGHLLRMDSRWPKIYRWIPHGRRRRGRPQQSWRNEVKDLMKRYGRR